MTENNLIKITQIFRTLIISRCKFCGFDQYLAENPDFEFPKITEDLLDAELDQHITIPGLFGGFSYFLTQVDSKPILYTEQSSRMDYDSRDYSYFAVTASGSRELKGDERAVIAQKFWQFARRAHEKRLATIKAAKRP